MLPGETYILITAVIIFAQAVYQKYHSPNFQLSIYRNGGSKAQLNSKMSNSNCVCLFPILPKTDGIQQKCMQSTHEYCCTTTIHSFSMLANLLGYRSSPWVAEHVWALALNMFPSENRIPGSQRQWQHTTPRLDCFEVSITGSLGGSCQSSCQWRSVSGGSTAWRTSTHSRTVRTTSGPWLHFTPVQFLHI